ncbi:helix-turn-helix domain-containing protein [Lactobacillus gigeriorum]|uniref:helix-turn-helix domain-containing protein n=1 Tax=Lactobacillus gigeriorum TaxID=1203069 RepID=UPI0002E7F05B|nr:helix-turn-helix transcriptional regulator [Lactobacillus gigeriorum]
MWSKVEKILKERNLTIYRLSKMTGISDNTLRNYRLKHSEPSFTNACKIADALGVSLDDLREDKNGNRS